MKDGVGARRAEHGGEAAYLTEERELVVG